VTPHLSDGQPPPSPLSQDIIERNIKRASDKSQADYSEVVYEAYGPGGTGIIIECLTDNLNRTAGDVKSTITKAGCKVADPGSVMFNFQRQGLLVIDESDEDAVFEAAMEAGADDIQPVFDEDGQPTTSFKVGCTLVCVCACQHVAGQVLMLMVLSCLACVSMCSMRGKGSRMHHGV
jgi:hypothetical protein